MLHPRAPASTLLLSSTLAIVVDGSIAVDHEPADIFFTTEHRPADRDADFNLDERTRSARVDGASHSNERDGATRAALEVHPTGGSPWLSPHSCPDIDPIDTSLGPDDLGSAMSLGGAEVGIEKGRSVPSITACLQDIEDSAGEAAEGLCDAVIKISTASSASLDAAPARSAACLTREPKSVIKTRPVLPMLTEDPPPKDSFEPHNRIYHPAISQMAET